MPGFTSFPAETFTFLAGIAAHNDKEWLAAHRPLYEAGYVAPARALVETIGSELRKLSPSVQFAPKIGASISRINRDIRLSRDKRQYRDHLDLWFWHGEKKSWSQPGFFMRVAADAVWLGAGIQHLEADSLKRYRDAVVDERAGAALVAALARVEAAGDYAVGSRPRKSFPRGYDRSHPRASYLLWEGLPAMARMSVEEAQEPDFADRALGHFRATWPVARWLLDEVTG